MVECSRVERSNPGAMGLVRVAANLGQQGRGELASSGFECCPRCCFLGNRKGSRRRGAGGIFWVLPGFSLAGSGVEHGVPVVAGGVLTTPNSRLLSNRYWQDVAITFAKFRDFGLSRCWNFLE